MKNVRFMVAAGAACLLFSVTSLQAIVLNFSNLPGTTIDFSGGGFGFTSAGGYQFEITTVSGGTGAAQGLDGYIATPSPFMITAPISSDSIDGIVIQTASVTGSGTLHITDANSLDLTGSVTWDTITTVNSSGNLNLTDTINITDMSYSGSNRDLNALAQAGSAIDTLSFSFTSDGTLEDLTSTGGSTSYAGSISPAPVPEPATFALLGVGLAGMISLRKRNRA
jgi:hypothetical protein